MKRVLLLGAGKIGRMITCLLSNTKDYEVTVADASDAALQQIDEWFGVDTRKVDASSGDDLRALLQDQEIVISALSFSFNPTVAAAAADTGTSYFDLTEDVETTRQVRGVAERAGDGQIFMPQCGLAPGFISIVANHLSRDFDALERVHMRVGALPQFPSNQMKYNLTWSTDGLINEYCNPCEAIHEGQLIDVLPLEGMEHFSLDGVRYEAFNTSGGLGTLCESFAGRVQELNYKTIRYMGHRDLAALLVNELKLNNRRDLLKDILEHAIPITYQDVVIVFCTVSGQRDGRLVQVSDARKIYHHELHNRHWGAIQLTTAAGICAVIDLFREEKLPQSGFVRQEDVVFQDFISNRFGRIYDSGVKTDFGV